MDFNLMLESFPQLLSGAAVTVQLLVLTLACGGLLAFPLGILASDGHRWLRLLISGYIAFFRGTPLLVQIFLVYYGFSQFGWLRSSALWPLLREAWFCTLLTLSLHTAAYTANILRGAIRTIPRGQIEAGKATGLKLMQIYRLIILPQAIRIGLPAYSNETISMMKATSLASTVTLMELTGVANTIVARTYAPYEIFITAALLYLALAWGLSRAIRLLEARLSRHMSRTSAPQTIKRTVSANAHSPI
ncbi:ABC transporter permease [Ochrobactrum soli]|uniref:ABC transporter permease n=1 Tax=Ochrobactrum soli TaxID=2448455 RepID=A0A849KWH7_9HYPH|nr:ABC transporter permease [[Ochrobactrum] soli]NNU63459.1 ABC transporter permease [[Ochrobactrum] soli]